MADLESDTTGIAGPAETVLPNQIKKAIGLIICAELLYTIVAAFVKWASPLIPHMMIIFGQSIFCFLCILPWVLYKKVNLKTERIPLHLFRAIVGLANFYMLYLALRFIPLSDAMLLNTTSPLFVPLIVFFWSGVRIPLKLWVGLLVGFAGVIVILRPGAEIFDFGSIIALASGIVSALVFTTIRYLSSTEPALKIIFYFFLIASIISGALAIPFWEPLSLSEWGILFAIGASDCHLPDSFDARVCICSNSSSEHADLCRHSLCRIG